MTSLISIIGCCLVPTPQESRAGAGAGLAADQMVATLLASPQAQLG